jgi:hypothetical protein
MAGRPKGSGAKKSKTKSNETFEISKEEAAITSDDEYFDELTEAQNETQKDSHSEAIQNLRDTLYATGIEYLDSDNITQLSIKLNKGIKDMGATDASKADSDAAIKAWGGNTQITQLDFLRRLKKMGVRAFWVRGIVNQKNPDAPMKFLFDDSHAKLADREIHRIIRHSNVSEVDQKKNLRNVGEQPTIPLRYRGGMGHNVSTGTNW